MEFELFEKQSFELRERMINAGKSEFSRRSYADASTDEIAREGGISKGLLFHYFGSKKNFYLYCLSCALERLVVETKPPQGSEFYEVLFAVMDEKLRVCRDYPDDMRFVNLASREASADVANEKASLFAKYIKRVCAASDEAMARAASCLRLRRPDDPGVLPALNEYVGALMSRELRCYQNTPDEFFKQSDAVKARLQHDIDLMLYGIVKE